MKTTQDLLDLNEIEHDWLRRTWPSIKGLFLPDRGPIYEIDTDFRFLHRNAWVWDLQDTNDIRDLLVEEELFRVPRGARRKVLLLRICHCLAHCSAFTRIELQSGLQCASGTKLQDHREDLRQYILTTYYPI